MTDVAEKYDKAERRKEKLKARVTEIDLIRGICVILMVIDHTFYDLFGVLPEIFYDYPPTEGFWRNAYNFSVDYWVCDARVVARFVVIAFFGSDGNMLLLFEKQFKARTKIVRGCDACYSCDFCCRQDNGRWRTFDNFRNTPLHFACDSFVFLDRCFYAKSVRLRSYRRTYDYCRDIFVGL